MDELEQSIPPKKRLKTMQPSNPSPQVVIGTMQGTVLTNQVTQDQREAEVGILEFVSPDTLGFEGIFKKRYTDFIVNEILPSGEVIHLTNLNAPRKKISLWKDESQKLPNEADSDLNDEIRPVNTSLTDTADGRLADDSAATEAESHDVSNEKADFTTTSDPSVNLIQAENQPTSLPSKEDSESNSATLGTQDVNLQAGINETQSAVESNAIAIWEQSRDKGQIKITVDDRATLRRFFDDETIEKCVDLFNKVINNPHRSRTQYGLVHSKAITDRTLRKEAHEAIKRIFCLRLETETDSQGVIMITGIDSRGSTENRTGSGPQTSRWTSFGSRGGSSRGGRGGYAQGKRGRQEFGLKKSQKEIFKELGGDYLHFTIYKENKDTLEVISYLAKQLHMKPNAFQFAGNKDRRAVTSQRVSVYRVFPDKLASLNRSLRNAKVGDYIFQEDKLALGDLQGNAFCITLRDCVLKEDATEAHSQLEILRERVRLGMEAMSDKGFINYFGLQRFGSFATRTDHIGKKLLQGDFKDAVDSILEFSPAALVAATDPESGPTISRDDRDRAMALKIFRGGGPIKQALDTLPRKFSAESNILRWLGDEEHKNDYRGALDSIPRNLRSMYVHAYQSLIWNLAVTHRWKTLGDRLVAGDLVLVNEHEDKVPAKQNEDVDAEGEIVIKPAEEDRAVTANERFERARALTAEEVASGRYTIFDVVFPTPGFDILYPEYMLPFYKKTMGSEQHGNLDPVDMVRKWKEISLSGSYRKIVARPLAGFSWDVCVYEGEDKQLVSTDLDTVHAQRATPKKPGEEKLAIVTGTESTDATRVKEQGADESGVDDGTGTGAEQLEVAPASSDQLPLDQVPDPAAVKRLGVVLNFKLGTSQYATMALRELMKQGGAREYKPDFSAGRGMD